MGIDGCLTVNTKKRDTASDAWTSKSCQLNLRRVSGGKYDPIEHIVFESLEMLLDAVTRKQQPSYTVVTQRKPRSLPQAQNLGGGKPPQTPVQQPQDRLINVNYCKYLQHLHSCRYSSRESQEIGMEWRVLALWFWFWINAASWATKPGTVNKKSCGCDMVQQPRSTDTIYQNSPKRAKASHQKGGHATKSNASIHGLTGPKKCSAVLVLRPWPQWSSGNQRCCKSLRLFSNPVDLQSAS